LALLIGPMVGWINEGLLPVEGRGNNKDWQVLNIFPTGIWRQKEFSIFGKKDRKVRMRGIWEHPKLL